MAVSLQGGLDGSALHLTHDLTSPKIIGYREKSIIVCANNIKISFTTSPNVKLLAIG